MAQLSMVAVAGLAYGAGIHDPVRLTQAVAIATAESGRNPDKLGDLALQNAEWGPSCSLWQIRSRKAEKGKGTLRDQDKLMDPAANARAMVEISGGGANWGPWSVTHPTQDPLGYMRYQAALPLAPAAVEAALSQKGIQKGQEVAQQAADTAMEPVRQLASTVSQAAQTPNRILNWFTQPGTWARVGYLNIGGALVILGIYLAAKGPIDSAVKTTAKAVK